MWRACAVVCALSGAGCVSFVSSTIGNTIDPAAVERVAVDRTTLPEVLEALGAPLEVHRHADGMLLVYRQSGRNTFRLGLDASRLATFIDFTQVTSEVLGNLSLTVERIHADQDRLVVLLDREGVVRAVASRRALDDLPVF